MDGDVSPPDPPPESGDTGRSQAKPPAPNVKWDDPGLAYVKEARDREWSRKDSLERRGITVITASGVFVTLIFGFASSVTKGHHFANFTHVEKVLLGVALILFVLSGFAALTINLPGSIVGPKLRDVARGAFSLDAAVEEVESLRDVNGGKANALVVATLLQLLAILTLGGTVGAVVL
jgi:hypothetical protein